MPRQVISMEISRNHLARALAQINPGYAFEKAQSLGGRASLLTVSIPEQAPAPLVLLSHGPRDRLINPDIAADEFRLLTALHGAGLPVPQPLYLARDHAPPYFISSCIPGSPRFSADDKSAFCRRLAALLSEIHAFDLAQRDLSYLPQLADRLDDYLAAAKPAEERIHDAMRRVAHSIKLHASALLHGDFWLGNLLWQGDQLCGVIDWEDAMLGDPLADLGKSRLEMLWALGEGAAREYTAHYLALNPQLDVSALPFWDLWGAARLSHYASFAGDPAKAAAMRQQYDRFIQAAFDALAASQK